MIKEIEISFLPEQNNEESIKDLIKKKLKLKNDNFHIIKKKLSLDSRKNPIYKLRCEIYINEKPPKYTNISDNYKNVENSNHKVIIVGAGPAGYFAALELLEYGIKPIIFERGKDVNQRRYDLRNIQLKSIVNPNSNYCFGEGGAGTYSDGKLYTRSNKRGNINKVLKILFEHGSKESILYESHPHIGSNKLPIVVKNIRETILKYGGEVNFNSLVTDLIIKNNEIKGVIVNNKYEYFSDGVILSIGHSSRDIFNLLYNKNIFIEFKPFALGVRIEHPQSLIDEIQYKQCPRSEYLPASSYSIVTNVENRGVFSFCMCPGGFIVPSPTNKDEIVLNGMSLSKRNSYFANSGFVVSVEKEDLIKYKYEDNSLMGLNFQCDVEKQTFDFGGTNTLKAPAQRLTDFLNNKLSVDLPKTSYIPGIYSAPIYEVLPEFISRKIKEGLFNIKKTIPKYITEEAVLIAVESRTSSPIRITRNKDTFEHIQIKNLYPCGEGAGYAGGIVSSAIDGQNVAKALSLKLNREK
jgi:uncharacterized FAD-dependent dehydrogenase